MALALTKPQARKLYVSCFWAQKLVLGQLELLPYLWQTTPEISRGKEGLNQMTNSTKLTDIPGASEAFNICDVCNGVGWYAQQVSYTEQEQRRCEACNGQEDDVLNIHLEVDVEAMAQKIYEYEHPNDTHWDNLTDGQKHEYIRKADFLTLWLTKWARLVRK